MSFNHYLQEELKKPVNNKCYNPDGNSNRAVVVRGFWGEVLWQYRKHPSRILSELRCFDGLSTEAGWFIQITLMILLSPIAPALAARHWYKKSLKEYKVKYEKSKNKDY